MIVYDFYDAYQGAIRNVIFVVFKQNGIRHFLCLCIEMEEYHG
jgi:hypothetical protein